MTTSVATLKVMERRFDLATAAGSSRLWTRQKAQQLRERAEGMLDNLEVGETLVIDADGVEVFDFSFANEFFGKILLGMKSYASRLVLVEHLNEYTRVNLEQALKGLELAMIERDGKKLHLLGKIHATDEETFQAVVKAKRPVTASELTKQLEVNVTAMNERLTKLTNLGVIRRTRGVSGAGRQQYEYTAP